MRDADDIEAERRTGNLVRACSLAAFTLLLLYPLNWSEPSALFRIGAVHLLIGISGALGARGWTALGAWSVCLGAGAIITSDQLGQPISGALYFVILPVIFAAATLSARQVGMFAGVVVGMLAALWAANGRPGGLDLERLLNVAAVVVIGGAIASVATRGSERLVESLVRARDEALAARQEAERAHEQRREAEIAQIRSEAAGVAKSAFLTAMSHELRTPLNAILGYSELVSDEIASIAPNSLEDLRRIGQASLHLRRLIDDVLDLSKIEAGRLDTLAEERVPLAPVLHEVEQTAAPLAARRSNVLEIDAQDSLSVVGDRTRLAQILLNLIGNSAKFTREGRISVEARAMGAEILLEVRDSGIGMNERQLAEAFEPFSQVGQAGPEGGTGLGLPLARRFAQAMGGRLEASSQLGEGTTMRLFLRRAPG